jgi:glycosyltransferase involved in cell wall biosynthesis
MLGDCGRLVEPDDRSALRDAILELLTDRDAYEKTASCGRTRVQKRFSLTRMVDAMRERYRDAA